MLQRVVLGFVLSLFTASLALAGFEPAAPNPEYTPGELCSQKDPDFSRYRYDQKIPYCERNVTFYMKTQIYELYGVPERERGNYTIDHFIPLSIGGSNGPENLWPEHKAIKRTRPLLEQEVFEAVRDGKMTQKQAIKIIVEAKMHPDVSAAH